MRHQLRRCVRSSPDIHQLANWAILTQLFIRAPKVSRTAVWVPFARLRTPEATRLTLPPGNLGCGLRLETSQACQARISSTSRLRSGLWVYLRVQTKGRCFFPDAQKMRERA